MRQVTKHPPTEKDGSTLQKLFITIGEGTAVIMIPVFTLQGALPDIVC